MNIREKRVYPHAIEYRDLLLFARLLFFFLVAVKQQRQPGEVTPGNQRWYSHDNIAGQADDAYGIGVCDPSRPSVTPNATSRRSAAMHAYLCLHEAP